AAYGRIFLDRRCGGETVALRAVGIRPVADNDPSVLLYTGYRGHWPRDPERDLRRVVSVKPAEPLPLDCVARLTLPRDLDDAGAAAVHGAGGDRNAVVSWELRTYGAPGLADVRCAHRNVCPNGPLRVEFNTPVRGADVLRHVRIAPETAF